MVLEVADRSTEKNGYSCKVPFVCLEKDSQVIVNFVKQCSLISDFWDVKIAVFV